MEFKRTRTRDLYEQHILNQLQILDTELKDCILNKSGTEEELMKKINEYMLELECLG